VDTFIKTDDSAELLLLNKSLSLRFNSHFPGEPLLANVYWSKGDGSGSDNWSYKTCNAPVKWSPL